MPCSFRERIFWFSPFTPASVDLNDYKVKRWEQHRGNSDSWLAVTGDRIGFLLKAGAGTVSKMAYFALAAYFDRPSQVGYGEKKLRRFTFAFSSI